MSTPNPAQSEPSFQDSFHFCVRAVADPAALSRVIEFFALNSILPDVVKARRFVNGDLTIDIKVCGMDEAKAAVVANKLRASVLVYGVTTEVVTARLDRLTDRLAVAS